MLEANAMGLPLRTGEATQDAKERAERELGHLTRLAESGRAHIQAQKCDFPFLVQTQRQRFVVRRKVSNERMKRRSQVGLLVNDDPYRSENPQTARLRKAKAEVLDLRRPC